MDETTVGITLETGSAGKLRYLVSYPAADAARGGGQDPWPVLCFLHGQGEAVPMPVERSAELHGPLSRTSWPEARRKFIIVEPQRPGRADNWVSDLEAVVGVVREVRQHGRGDPARTYLTGFSLGGNGVLDFAAGGPDVWAGYWAVDPTRLPPRIPSRPMWVSAGPLTKWNRGYPAMKAADVGDAGDAGGAGGVARAFRVTDEADDHVEAAAKAYGRAEVYLWLLTKHL